MIATKEEILLPPGYTFRPTCMDDAAGVVDMFNAWSQMYLGVTEFTEEMMEREWRTPGYDIGELTRVVVDPRGQVAGYYELWDNGYPHAILFPWGRIHPEHAGRGIGSFLLAWAESRAREIIPQAPAEARVALRAWVFSHLTDADLLMRDSGFDLIRYNLRMVIDLNGQPPEPRIPKGIIIRPMRVGQDERATFDTIHASFRDHWGYIRGDLEEKYKQFLHGMEDDNEFFDPNLWYLAWYGDRVVGTSLCQHHISEDAGMGWVSSLGVFREWRRRGLGQALLEQSFSGLYERGQRRVGLGVDASSLTGATGLYERAGMHSDPKRTFAIYEKELRPGKDLSITSAG